MHRSAAKITTGTKKNKLTNYFEIISSKKVTTWIRSSPGFRQVQPATCM